MASEVITHAAKAIVSVASRVAPRTAGRLAYKLFCTPLQLGGLSPEQKRMEQLAEARLATADAVRVKHPNGEVQCYKFNSASETSKGPTRGTVILVHGWMSGARFMLAFVDPICDQGFDVVCLDLPAHGKSSGRSTNFIDCAKSLIAVAQHFAPIHAIVAHSFGGAVTASAVSGLADPTAHLPLNKIALIASPNELANVAHNFGAAIGLQGQGQAQFEARLEAASGRALADLTGSLLYKSVGVPILVLHSEDDREVPFNQGLKYRALPNCDVVPLQGLGHRRILYAPEVTESVAGFLAG
jgi:pimeloyl-ACP methyl ester carboxylesterase